MPNDPRVDGRILQWDHLTKPQQRVVSDNMETVGRELPTRVGDQIEKTKTSKAKKASQTQATLEAVAPHVKSEPVTLQRAANNRQRLYQDSLVRQHEGSESPDNVSPEGSDWYFEHNARIAHSADQTGFPRAWAHTASAVMSPQNSPENERAAVSAIMDAHANAKVEVDHHAVAHLADKGIDVSALSGQTVHVDQMPTGSLAHLSDSATRSRVRTDADLRQVARGGTKANVVKAESVLMGEVDPKDAVVNDNGAITGSKVASYAHVISQAEPGSPTHVEFMGRVHQDALARAAGGGTGKPTGPVYRHVDPKRGPDDSDKEGARYADYDEGMDLYGIGHDVPRDHLLSPNSHTVEDTWQNSVTFNQPKTLVGEKSRTSVFKAGGSGAQYPPTGLKTGRDAEGNKVGTAHPDARVNDGVLLHAYNNRATQKASEQQGRNTNTVMPPVAMQGVAWTEARRQAGKSPEGAQGDYQTEVDVYRRMGRTVPQSVREEPAPAPSKFEEQHPGHVRGQQALFGDDIPGGEHARESHPEDDMTDSEKEADMRKWAAIGTNVRRGKRR